ncbi:HNH endonuclease [Microbacterium sp. 69-10]|uniref:HNH endonuclease n=1 Tax=Microbacterium sp. 69-10 TaxID=1895783 RepID=UPI0025FEDE5E|nr:HNH endonuclease [Microbacterium sp. 69-10]
MRQGRRCAYCGELTENPDPEHVVPLSRGGRNDMSNLVTACRACNTDKGDMTPAEWSADRAHRGKPALNTDLQGTAFTHLWIREPMNEAWRHRKAA